MNNDPRFKDKFVDVKEIADQLIMTPDEQLDLWVKGESVHNGKNPGEGECCPDFSCCNPTLQWNEARRELFARLFREKNPAHVEMLMGGLSGVIEGEGPDAPKVYLSGFDDPPETIH